MNRMKRLSALCIVFGLVLAACAPVETGAPEATTAPMEEGMAEVEGLAAVCPGTVVIQTDWFPEAEHGAVYNLIGEGYTIDTGVKSVTGPLVSGGDMMGIDVEVRAGGPAIGFQQPSQQMYLDEEITLGYVSTDEAIFSYEDTPTLAVLAPLEKNPQIIMWDPETYPDVESIADLGAAGVTINVFAGGTFIEIFANEGIVSADQIDPSYDGSPSRWVAEDGAIAQQGFASAEPFTYENEIEEWGKPVAFQLIHDAGLEIYSQPLAIRAGDLESMTPCLTELVPIIQQSTVDYAASPDRANAIIIDTVATFNDFWIYNEDLAAFSIAKQLELGLVGNGPDATLGNMVEERIQGVIDQMSAAGMEIPEVSAADLFTNEFIDESIGLP